MDGNVISTMPWTALRGENGDVYAVIDANGMFIAEVYNEADARMIAAMSESAAALMLNIKKITAPIEQPKTGDKNGNKNKKRSGKRDQET